MTFCVNYHPTHQAQLEYRWGGRYGGANCTACSAGMDGQAHTCGAMLFTGAQIRAASNEPVPDPRSPGLNLAQVHAALLKLSGGKIDLDVRYRTSFDSVKLIVTDGAQAIVQINRGVLIDRGHGHGNGFRGGHAMTVGTDSGGLWFDDPLTGRWHVDWETLKRACGALIIDGVAELCGYGRAYVAYTRDLTADYQATCRPIKLGIYRTFTRYFVNAAGRITTHEIRRTKGFQLPCTAPRLLATERSYQRHASDPTYPVRRVSMVQITKAGSSMDGWWLASHWSEK